MDNMQLWLSSSTDSINLNDSAEGFYLNPDLEGLTGLPEIRSVNGLNAGYDGGWTATQLWAARLITIRGVIAINDKAAVETKRKALAKLLAQGKSEDLELKFVSEAGNTYTTTVRTTGCTMALQRVFWRQEYQIQLRANDPLIYDDGGSELVAILRVMAGEGGFEIPFDIPFDIGGSITPTSVDVGDEATYPLIRLKGDLHNPTIINMTTNQRMQVLADIIATVEWRDYTTTYTTNGFAQINNGIDGAPLSLTHLYGNTTQTTISGKNLFNINDVASITNTSYTQDGWATATYDNTAGSSSVFCNFMSNMIPATLVPTDTTCTVVTEIKSVSGNGTLYVTSSNVQTQFKPQKSYGFSSLSAGMVLVDTVTSKSDYTDVSRSTRTYVRYEIGESGSITYRISVIKGTGVTPQNFVYTPFVGGSDSPNPDYPQDVNVVTGLQTVKITGKNLLNNTLQPAYTSHSTAQTINSGYRITMSDNAINALCAFALFKSSEVLGKSITLSYTAEKSASNRANAYIGLCDANGNNRMAKTNIPSGEGYRSGTYTHTEEDATRPYIVVALYSNYSGTAQNGDYVDYKNLQLEIGNQATTFEPYQGQSYTIDLVLGKNRFSGSFSQFNNRGGTGSSYTYFKLPDDGEYTLSLKAKNNVPAQSQQVFIGFSADGGQSTGGVRWVWTNSTTASAGDVKYANNLPSGAGENMHFVSLYAPTEATLQWFVDNFDIQLEKGTAPTNYEAYNTIELAKIGTYQDYIWNDNGTWKIHKAVGKFTLDGTQTSSSYIARTNTFRAIFQSGITGLGSVSADNRLSKSEKFTNDTGIWGNDKEGFYVDNANVVVSANIATVGNTIASMKTWFASNPTKFYTPLLTPTDTEITDSELLEQLSHIYELYQGTNNLWLIPSAGAQGEMEVSYATTEDIDYHEVVIDCQARTVTQDGHNLYPALADGSEFIRLLPGENKLYLTSEVESDNGTAEVKFKKGNISI